MKGNISKAFFSIILLFCILNFTSCSHREETVSCFPDVPINVTLLPNELYNLQTQQWTYVNRDGAGTRGLIVVKTTKGYNVYDRNAPHICPDNNTTLNVDGNIKIVCPADGAEWILLTGEPIKISKLSPKTYPYNFDSYTNTLSIYY